MFLKTEEIEQIVSILNKEIKPTLIYLFGSFARGEGRADSDIDLAVHAEMSLTGYQLFILSGELSSALGREVQLIDFKEASAVLGAQIVGNHQVLFCEDDVFRANLNIRFLKDYALLNEERACILERIEEEGTIYG